MRIENIDKNIANTTQLAEEQDEYQTLPILVNFIDGAMVRTSYWKPNLAEIKILENGGSIALSIYGEVHPPVDINIEEGAKWRHS